MFSVDKLKNIIKEKISIFWFSSHIFLAITDGFGIIIQSIIDFSFKN